MERLDEENEYYWNVDICHLRIDVGLSESVKEKNDDDDDDLTFIKTTMFLFDERTHNGNRCSNRNLQLDPSITAKTTTIEEDVNAFPLFSFFSFFLLLLLCLLSLVLKRITLPSQETK